MIIKTTQIFFFAFYSSTMENKRGMVTLTLLVLVLINVCKGKRSRDVHAKPRSKVSVRRMSSEQISCVIRTEQPAPSLFVSQNLKESTLLSLRTQIFPLKEMRFNPFGLDWSQILIKCLLSMLMVANQCSLPQQGFSQRTPLPSWRFTFCV